MSRGLGWMQKYLVRMIRQNRKPMTFEDIRAFALKGAPVDTIVRVSAARSMRRALHSLARDKFLMVIGEGGPSDPFRYVTHPLFVGAIRATNPDEGHELEKALEDACKDFEGRYQM